MSAKLEVQWTPIPNKFITWGSEICLYEVYQRRDSSLQQSIKLSSTSYANLLATNTNHHFIKCLDIYPKSDVDILLAVGLSNGKIALSTFGPTEYDNLGWTGKELVPRHGRQCNDVAWNPVDTNLIAAGLDKYRSDNSVLIWDINSFQNQYDNNSLSGRLCVNTLMPAVELAKPLVEYGASEICHSLTWFNTNSKLLAVGINLKNIRLIDIRDKCKVVKSTLTKAVFGTCVDPNDDRHLGSFYDNQIYIWDTRNFDKPILTLSHNTPVMKIGWCPTKYNVLGSLQKDNSTIHLYDIQHTIIGNEEVDLSVLERVIAPGSPHNIMSFSWHKTDENRFLTIALSGTIMDCTVFDRITLNWAPGSNLVWTSGRKKMKYICDSPLNDISTQMRERAIAGYGLKDELWKNGEIVDNEVLANVWNWLHLSKRLVDEHVLGASTDKYPGVHAILKIDPSNNKSDMITLSWSDLGMTNCQGTARIFKHPDRSKALHLCSWHFDRDSNMLEKFLEQLENEKAYTRAAAIAVFNLKLRLAIDILDRAPDEHLNIVAMALAGFSDDKYNLWKQFCTNTKNKLTDAYLKVIFSFLTAENHNYENILNETGIAVDDRVAFACIFLPDNRLNDYLIKLTDKLVEEGNLDGFLLTGSSQRAIILLQKYIDMTGDIQSTVLLSIQAFPHQTTSGKLLEWVTCYRNLLDKWQLWNVRAEFDIMLHSLHLNDEIAPQVYVSCTFCGKNTSGDGQDHSRARSFPRINVSANKISSCPNCRKPLPRCAICLMHMGTTPGLGHNEYSAQSLLSSVGGNGSNDETSNKINEFSNWFTWCQTCRHGGHSSHIIHWFKEHTECPVTACNCKCFSIDSLQ